MNTHSIPLKPSQLCDRVRQRLGLLVTDRTIRRWRAEAFIERKKFYTEQDVKTIAEYASLLMQLGDVNEARSQFAHILHSQQTQEEPQDVSQCIDVEVEVVA